ncbi:hypothetical protein ACFWPU_36185 [Streptomyces sp. NPDC058471]|uniref:hypothetical protein n=1 Tax=Streptomyces sp. NPDC058471 TaxID=3346516 RepID=UPI0036568489
MIDLDEGNPAFDFRPLGESPLESEGGRRLLEEAAQAVNVRLVDGEPIFGEMAADGRDARRAN